MTQQGGIVGPWLERLPHFRLEFTPSHGAELQGEYLVPRRAPWTRSTPSGSLRPRLEGLLAGRPSCAPSRADDLWLSSAYGTDVVGVPPHLGAGRGGGYAVLPDLEAALLPLGARPHWGKCFSRDGGRPGPLYPRLGDFRALRDRVDPDRTFGNAFLDRVIG